MTDSLAAFMSLPGFNLWRKNVVATRGCAHPIKIAGLSHIKDRSSGAIIKDSSGTKWVACGTRRANVCPPCAATYADDAFHLIRSGLAGDETKGIDADVADRSRLFVTLTAPSFGPVHSRPKTSTGKSRPCSCGSWHSEGDFRLGTAVDPTTYDYEGAVLWQALAGELWGRFTTYLRRAIAKSAGIPVSKLTDHARLSFAKVGEFQRRGLIHFHAAIRLDGPGGIGATPPAWATPQVLEGAVKVAASSASRSIDRPDGRTLEVLFGSQIDIRDITTASQAREGDPFDPERLASYIAKYATKSTNASEDVVERRIKDPALIDRLPVSQHHKHMMHTAWRLGGMEQYASLNLRRWTHMLGFRGHVLTKSRAWSTTMTELRTARAKWRLVETLAELGIDDEDDVIVINDWQPVAFGHATEAQRELADAIGTRLLNQQRQKRKEPAHE